MQVLEHMPAYICMLADAIDKHSYDIAMAHVCLVVCKNVWCGLMCLNISTHVQIYRCASMFVSVWMLVHMPLHMFIWLMMVVMNDNHGGDVDGLMMMDGDDGDHE